MRFFPLILLLLGLSSCELDTRLLAGDWKATAFYRSGKTASAPLDSVLLTFSENGHYSFRTIGFYREAGPYRASGKFLFLTDSTAKPPRERMVEVLFLSADTLKLGMRKDSVEQVLFLAKTPG